MNAVVWTLVNGPGIFIQRSTFNAPPAQVARHQFHELARPVGHEVTSAFRSPRSALKWDLPIGSRSAGLGNFSLQPLAFSLQPFSVGHEVTNVLRFLFPLLQPLVLVRANSCHLCLASGLWPAGGFPRLSASGLMQQLCQRWIIGGFCPTPPAGFPLFHQGGWGYTSISRISRMKPPDLPIS